MEYGCSKQILTTQEVKSESSIPSQVIFINSHPIQYFVPLYQFLNRYGITTACWYCSDENVNGHFDRQFGKNIDWDIPLLEGYSFRFFRNWARKPSIYNGFFGLINPGLWWALVKHPPAVVVVHGWASLTNVVSIIISRLRGHTVCLRGESPWNQELLKTRMNRVLKSILLQTFLFKWPNYFLYIGNQNRMFYERMGVSRQKLIFAPYAVDNSRFQSESAIWKRERTALRESLNLQPDATIYLFCAKLIEKKRPQDLISAFARVVNPNKMLVLVGEGELRTTLERQIDVLGLRNVKLVGFVNQSEIAKYYAAADIFVMTSGIGETWGLSVNEAMNFGMPIVVSNVAGCASDLVQEGETGFTYPCGDVAALHFALEHVQRLVHQNQSIKWINRYSFQTIADGLAPIVGETFSNLEQSRKS